MISNTQHERNVALEVLRGANAIHDYYKGMADSLEGTPTHRFYWWRMRLLCRLGAWAAEQVRTHAFLYPEQQP